MGEKSIYLREKVVTLNNSTFRTLYFLILKFLKFKINGSFILLFNNLFSKETYEFIFLSNISTMALESHDLKNIKYCYNSNEVSSQH